MCFKLAAFVLFTIVCCGFAKNIPDSKRISDALDSFADTIRSMKQGIAENGRILKRLQEIADIPVRLVNGSTPLEGRVQVFHKGVWGNVCDDNFSNEDAQVVCRSLGYTRGSTEGNGGNHVFGPGNGTIWLDEVNCTGNEMNLAQCGFEWHGNSCSALEDVGVKCEANTLGK